MQRWTRVLVRQALVLRSQSSKRYTVAVVWILQVEPELARVSKFAIWFLDLALVTAASPAEHLNRWDLTMEWIAGEILFHRLNNTMVRARQCDNDHLSKQNYRIVSICKFYSRNITPIRKKNELGKYNIGASFWSGFWVYSFILLVALIIFYLLIFSCFSIFYICNMHTIFSRAKGHRGH